MIATLSTAERPPASPVSAQSEAPAGKGSYKAAGAFNLGSASFLELLQQSSVGPAVEDSTPSSGLPKKESKSKKSGSDSPGFDAQVPGMSGDKLQIGLPFTPQTGVDSRAQPEHLSDHQPDAVLPPALPVTASATQDELQVELNSNGSGSSVELAFALRLKPLAATATAEGPGEASPPPSHGVATKSVEISAGAIGNLFAGQSGKGSGADTQSGNDDSSRGNHAAAHKTVLPDQPEKAGRTEKVEAPAPVESSNAHTQTEGSRLTPLTTATTSVAPLGGPAAPKATAQPAPAPAAATLDVEDRLATTRPSHEISLQISSDGDHKVDVRLVERAGEVLVSVRTPDVALAHEMRQELGSLTGKLAQSGYGTEQFTPLAAGSSNLSDQRSNPENQDASRGHSQNPEHGGSGQQQQPQDERGKRPAWVEEMEDSLAKRQNNRSTSWLFNR